MMPSPEFNSSHNTCERKVNLKEYLPDSEQNLQVALEWEKH